MRQRNWRRIATEGGIFLSLVLVSIVLVRCGGTNTTTGLGASSVTISDPPSCTNQFMHVYVTVTGVKAHTSASAGPSTPGWQNLTSQLSNANPVQLDLLNLTNSTQQPIECLLKTLGSEQSLPVGSYQQLRLMLASNGSGGTLPKGVTNQCTTTGGLPSGTLDCVETVNPDGTPGPWYPLELSSHDQTGLKIPPGQILGGPINVTSGKTVSININFNTCSSLVPVPVNGAYRLNPTLTASQVSTNTTSGISGTVVYGTVSGASPSYTVTPISPLTPVAGAWVKLELPAGGTGDTINGTMANPIPTDQVIDTALTDSKGNFYFCPVGKDAGPLDLVADAPGQQAGTTAGATIIQGVPTGIGVKLGGSSSPDLPIIQQPGSTNVAGQFAVTLTGTPSTTPTSQFNVTIDLLPMQQFTNTAGNLAEAIIPALFYQNSADNPDGVVSATLTCHTSGNCSTTASPSASLTVPANAPLVGSYGSGGAITWPSAPAVGGSTASTGSYVIQADGSVGNSPAHTCSTTFTSPQTATAGTSGTSGTPTPVSIALSNCQ